MNTFRIAAAAALVSVVGTMPIAQSLSRDIEASLDPLPLRGFSYSSNSDDRHTGHGWSAGRADGHAPIGVMADHTHAAGEWMVSIRFMQMHMEGMRNNQDSLSSADVFALGFPVTPTEMDMEMIMLGGMYAPTDALTLMLMLPYISMSMDHLTMASVEFTTESEGIGDLRLSGLYTVVDANDQRVHLSLGLSVPTGSIDERDDTPAMMNAKLPYPMQLGTGTFDLLPGITYLGQSGDWSWGGQASLRFHTGENDEDYRHGNRADATGWVARRFGDFSASFRLASSHWENFHGSDSDLNPNMVPTADPDLRGGDRLDALLGANWHHASGNRLALEVGAPVYQDLDGPALETDWIATIGWQYAP